MTCFADGTTLVLSVAGLLAAVALLLGRALKIVELIRSISVSINKMIRFEPPSKKNLA